MLKEAAEFIRRYQEFILISHISPDGDTLGSSLALSIALKNAGKKAEIVCGDPVPEAYRFLPGASSIRKPSEVQPTEAVITVDCSTLSRTGDSKRLFDSAKESLCIDHHRTNTGFADVNFIRRKGAAGELIVLLLKELGYGMDREIGMCLYAAIATDTGNFSYSGTTPDTFRAMAEILETGFDLPEVNRLLFRTIPLRKVRLTNLVLERMQLSRNNAVAVSYAELKDFAACCAGAEDSDGIIDSMRDIDTVECAAFLREAEDGSIRVSFRAKSKVDISLIASEYDGGGHRLAAGCTLNMSMEEAFRLMTEKLQQAYDGAER